MALRIKIIILTYLPIENHFQRWTKSLQLYEKKKKNSIPIKLPVSATPICLLFLGFSSAIILQYLMLAADKIQRGRLRASFHPCKACLWDCSLSPEPQKSHHPAEK